ncbi:hypothetical protein, partial [Pseudomonas palleroniana]
WLTLPLAGCVEDFHLPVTSVATTAKLVALARNAPCLAHQKKRPTIFIVGLMDVLGIAVGAAMQLGARQALQPLNGKMRTDHL